MKSVELESVAVYRGYHLMCLEVKSVNVQHITASYEEIAAAASEAYEVGDYRNLILTFVNSCPRKKVPPVLREGITSKWHRIR